LVISMTDGGVFHLLQRSPPFAIRSYFIRSSV
jgi:hypothetical protein